MTTFGLWYAYYFCCVVLILFPFSHKGVYSYWSFPLDYDTFQTLEEIVVQCGRINLLKYLIFKDFYPSYPLYRRHNVCILIPIPKRFIVIQWWWSFIPPLIWHSCTQTFKNGCHYLKLRREHTRFAYTHLFSMRITYCLDQWNENYKTTFQKNSFRANCFYSIENSSMYIIISGSIYKWIITTAAS